MNKIQELFRSRVYARADEKPYVFLFSHTDFEGLKYDSFNIESCLGHTLVGGFYYYDNPIKSKLVIFDHGMFGGRRSYMREIEMLARHGYLVYAYDHTGCMESGGKDNGGFSGSLRDLDEVITKLKELNELKGRELYVMGHSWGGFSTLNIAKFHPNIKKIVALAGFISPKVIIKQHVSGPYSLFSGIIYRGEVKASPKYMKCSAIDTLKNSDVEALICHSSDDHMVNYKKNFVKLRKALKSRRNTIFLSVPHADHNPNYTKEAIKAKQEFYAKMQQALDEGKLNTKEECEAFKKSFDWYKITEQNEFVWDKIFSFLDGKPVAMPFGKHLKRK